MKNTLILATGTFLLAMSQGCRPQTHVSELGTYLPAQASPSPSMPVGWPTCDETYVAGGGQFFNQLKCVPQLDQIGFWESREALDRFSSVPVRVAVIDGYFNVEHPDIQAAILRKYSLAEAECYPVNFANAKCLDVLPPADVPVTDANIGSLNHGTMIAGVIAGRGVPGRGVVGINPSANLMVIAKARDPNDTSGYVRALRGAIDLDPDVISMSFPLGPAPGLEDIPEFRALLETAVSRGIVVVMAAGNSRRDVNSLATYPTRYSTIKGVIAVGATNYGSFAAQYSNFGSDYVSLSAPGLVLSSAGKNEANAPYYLMTGTSFSGPLVAGAASRVIQVLKSKNIDFRPADIEQILYAGSDSKTELTPYFEKGRALNLKSLSAFVESLSQQNFPIQ